MSDDRGRALDCIALSGMAVDCIVGVYGHERTQPQPLIVDLALYLNTRKAKLSAGLEGTVDYARLAGEVRFLLQSCRFRTLEHAAEALARYILLPPTADAPRAQVEVATVKLHKPQALPGQALPSLEITRRASEVSFLGERKPFGQVDIVYESPAKEGEAPAFGIYRLRVNPKGTIPVHLHRVMEEHELVLGSGLWLQGRPVRRGTAFHWPQELPHRYDNPSPVEQTILCVDAPAFIPADEVEVPEPPAGLPPMEGESFYPRGDGESS